MKEITYSRFMSETAVRELPTSGVKTEVTAQVALGVKDADPSTSMRLGLAAKLGKEMGLGKEPDEILAGLIDTQPSIQVDGENARKAIETNFAGDPRRAVVESQDALVRDFLGKKYDALSPADQLKMRDFVDGTIQSWPPGKNVMDGLDPAQRQQVLENILKDPSFRTHLEAQYNNLFNTDPPQWKLPENPEDSPTILPAVKEYQAAVMTEERLQREYTKITRDLAAAERLSTEHNAELDASGVPIGTKAQEIVRLEGEILARDAGNTTYVEELQSQIDKKRAQRDDLIKSQGQRGADVAAIGGAIATLTGEIDGLDTQAREYQILVLKKNKLVQERDELPAKKSKLEEDQLNKSHEMEEGAKATAVKLAELEELLIDLSRRGAGHATEVDRLKAELEGKLNGIVTKAAREWLKTQVTEINAKIDSEWETMANERIERAQNAMIKNIKEHYRTSDKDKIHWWDKDKKINKRVESDFQMLIDPNEGIDAIFEDELLLVAEEFDQEYFVYDTVTREPVGLSDFGREQFATTHKDFAERVKKQLAKTTVQKKLQTGGFSKEEAKVVLESEWMGELIGGDEDLKKKIDHIMHKDGFVGSRAKWLNEKAKSPLGLATLFLLLGPLPVGAYWAINKSFNGGGGHATAH